MKKLIALLTVTVLCLSCLASCGGTKQLADYTLADTEKYVTLGSYKGVSVSQAEIDSNVQSQLDTVLSESAYDEAKNGAAEDGDKITFSCTATIGEAAAEALTMTDKTVTVGSGTVAIDALEEAFKGMSAGDTKEVTATVPESFSGDDTVDGKEAVFTVTVSNVSETVVPDTLNDEMVSTYTEGQYPTVSAYKEYLEKTVKENLAFSAALATCTFSGYPTDLAELYYNNSILSYTSQAQSYGVSLDTLISLYGMTSDAFYNYLAKQSAGQAQQDLALCAIALKEGFDPTDSNVQHTVDSLMQQYGFATEDELYASIDKKLIRQTAKHQMVVEMLAENAVVTD